MAYEIREGTYDTPNKTLASGAVFSKVEKYTIILAIKHCFFNYLLLLHSVYYENLIHNLISVCFRMERELLVAATGGTSLSVLTSHLALRVRTRRCFNNPTEFT